MGNYEFSLAQNYTMLYLMILPQQFLKHCLSKTGFHYGGLLPFSSQKMTKSFPITSQYIHLYPHKVLIPPIVT